MTEVNAVSTATITLPGPSETGTTAAGPATSSLPRLRILSDQVLVKFDKPLDRYGSIIIPESARSKPMTGTVVETGPGLRMKNGWFRPTGVKIGDKVVFKPHAARERNVLDPKRQPSMRHIGPDHCLIWYDDLLGILEEDACELDLVQERPSV